MIWMRRIKISTTGVNRRQADKHHQIVTKISIKFTMCIFLPHTQPLCEKIVDKHQFMLAIAIHESYPYMQFWRCLSTSNRKQRNSETAKKNYRWGQSVTFILYNA